jgi:hypothetical protein
MYRISIKLSERREPRLSESAKDVKEPRLGPPFRSVRCVSPERSVRLFGVVVEGGE